MVFIFYVRNKTKLFCYIFKQKNIFEKHIHQTIKHTRTTEVQSALLSYISKNLSDAMLESGRIISNPESYSKMKSQYYIMQKNNQHEQPYHHTNLQIYMFRQTTRFSITCYHAFSWY